MTRALRLRSHSLRWDTTVLKVHRWLFKRLKSIAADRKADFTIGGRGDPYLRRWYLVRSRVFSLYLHEIRKSDRGRDLHDHRSFTVSWLIDGPYLETSGGLRRRRDAGDLIVRPASLGHRIDLIDPSSTWTLFLTGPTYHHWGFYTDQGFVPWKDYKVDPDEEEYREP